MDFKASMVWGTPIIEVMNPEHARTKEALVRYCYELERQAGQPIESGVTVQRKSRLYESRFDFFTHNLPEIHSLRQFCGEALSHAVLRLYQEATRSQGQVGGLKVDLFESWVHITHDGGYHEVHTHCNCSWCGIYYLEPGDSTLDPPNGVNRFFSPTEVLYVDFGTLACPQTPIVLPPTEGKLLLFPSYVRHSAVPYRGTRDRIVVSFNSRIFANTGSLRSNAPA